MWVSFSYGALPAGNTIGIDFGGIAPASGSNFNGYSDLVIANGGTESFADLGVGSLVDTMGNALSVGFSVTNNSGHATGRATITNGVGGAGLLSDSTIYSDSIISNDTGSNRLTDGTVSPLTRGHLVLTFSGLDDSLTYNLTGGWDSNNSNFDAIWTSDGETAVTNSAGNGFVTLTDLSTDGSGNLAIYVIRTGNDNGRHLTIAGLQLDAVGSDGGLNFPLTTPVGGYSFPDAFPGLNFTEIASLEKLPGHPEKLFVVETRGIIWMIPDVTAATPTKVLILNRSSVNTDHYLNGMGGVAFHPDFDNNGYIYVTYPSFNNWTRVSRFTADPNNLGLIDNATEQVLIQENYHRSHGFNRLLFGPDGYLYIPVGDGKQLSHYNRPANRVTQTIDEGFWSSVLRIDVDKLPGNHEPQNLVSNDANGNWSVPTTGGVAHYSIPADNPFLDQAAADGRGVSTSFGKAADPLKVRTEMYAIGFRNPWKIGFVPGTSDLWVADVMASQKERYMIMPKGGNAGWAFYSGTGDVEWLQTTHGLTAPTGFQYVQPVVEYAVTDSNSGSRNKSIIGGEFYTAPDISALTNAFLMCDYNRGNIFAVHRPDHTDFQMVNPVPEANGDYSLDDMGIQSATLGGVFAFGSYNSTIEQIGVETGITAMLPNPTTGEMLLADSDNGIIRKITFSTGSFDAQLPQTLSSTGAFTDVGNFQTTPEMHPYDVNLTFWSDGADKTRFFNMVDATQPIQYSEDGFWQFPTGAVTMKHFDMDLDKDNPGTHVQRIETRFLVKTASSYYGVTYQWNAAGTEATLVDENGTHVSLPITENGVTTNQQWRIPSRAECYQCHTSNNGVMLGFNTRQLNHVGQLNGNTGNYLDLLEAANYLSTIGSSTMSLPKVSPPSDLSVNLEERVKSYLHVNCAYCHYDGNTLVPDSWSGEHHLSIEGTNLLHGQAIGFQIADPTDRLVIPGDTANSIILSRASATNGYSRMPPVGSSIVDPEGIALLADWIGNYANAKPTLDTPTAPYSVVENSPVSTSVGGGPQVTDLDAPDPARGTLTYSIIGGNTSGLFGINAATGEITLVQNGLDFEEITTETLTIEVSDGFAANPGVVTTTVVVNVSDIVGNPFGDLDGDGSPELFEFWADSDPVDPTSLGVTISPYEASSVPGSESFSFEWTVRSDLVIGSDYKVQGATDLNFGELVSGTDFSFVSLTPVANGAGPSLTRVRIKVPSTSEKYFLRLASVPQ